MWSVLFQTISFLHPRICQSPLIAKPHPPTRFYCPHNRKMWFLYLNSHFLPIFARILPVKQSNMNRFRNSFHSRIAFSKLYITAAQSLSRHELRCMKIIIETFLRDIRFPCISSLVFEAITISISRDLLARQTEQFDTTNDFLGRKLTKLENCIFRSARDRFEKSRLF